MLLLKLAVTLVLAYALLVVLAWAFQERLAFPARRARGPDPRAVGLDRGERLELMLEDRPRLMGRLVPPAAPAAGRPGPAPLRVDGHGEAIATRPPTLPGLVPPHAGTRRPD